MSRTLTLVAFLWMGQLTFKRLARKDLIGTIPAHRLHVKAQFPGFQRMALWAMLAPDRD